MKLLGVSAWVVLVLTLCLTIQPVTAEDFYELLGVVRQASAKEIRKAFKKLALVLHPDKNRDDAAAHEKFLRLNRAYEVLKDDDLRKKYDAHGEEGLNAPSGGGYQSWNFYNQEFGIYDEDQEIITLSKSDFELSVDGTADVWFINYYSPQCSHCHDLAPTWREMARDLFGVIRIGAVNCGDDWHLCRQKGVHSYPTLILYPENEKYLGDRTRKQLVKFALSHVRAQVVELWAGNFHSEVREDQEKARLPWVITFCGGDGDCLERMTVTKLSAMLSDLANVAVLYCADNKNVCAELGADHGTWFYPAGMVVKGSGQELHSLDASELALAVLQQLPDVTELSRQTFQDVQSGLAEQGEGGGGRAWLILFTEDSVHDVELRKLPALLGTLNVGRVDCRAMRSECNDLHIHKFPTFVVFKLGGGHEIHYGRQTAHDIAAFARDSSQTPVRVLGPVDFPRVTNQQTSWFIDFFAPWCPPCMQLLPEFRKASKQVVNVIHFGTVDCTVHVGLCNTYNIHSYPTTILYNQTVPHQYHGHHGANDIVEFLQDIMDPPVLTLEPDSFDTLIGHKPANELWLVDFYAPWCGPCQQLAPEWRKLAKMLKGVAGVRVGQVDCQAHRSLCQLQHVDSYPSVLLYPPGRTDTSVFHVYNGWFRDAPSMRAWALEFLPSSVESLDRDRFHATVLPGTQPWIVDFYAPWCGHCTVFAPEFARVAAAFEGRVRAGKVNCDQQQQLCQEAGVRAYPTVRFYPGATAGKRQHASGEDINSQDANYITGILNGRVSPAKRLTDEL